MYTSLLDQLQLCSATSSLQNCFANPSSSYHQLCPRVSTWCPPVSTTKCLANDNKRFLSEKEKNKDRETKEKKVGYGSILNTTGKKIDFPRGMEKIYCSDFLDVGVTCRHGETCHFEHTLFPKDFQQKTKL